MWSRMTMELGIDTSTFLGVRMRVTKALRSTTSPSVSEMRTRSPTWMARV
jgi:hypothetical protein